MAAEPIFLGIGNSDDPLFSGVLDAIEESGASVARIAPCFLGDHSVAIRSSRCWFDGAELLGVLFRSAPNCHFSTSFRAADQHFSDVESRALWLAALKLESVFVLNRYEAVTWFDDAGWAEWRRLLITAGISAMSVRYTSANARSDEDWLPFGSLRMRAVPPAGLLKRVGASLSTSSPKTRHALIGKQLIGLAPPKPVEEAAELLRTHGIQLAELVGDAEGRVCWVDTLPSFEAPVVELVIQATMEMWREHLRTR